MKTITLDEEAYARLKAWKRNNRDSFSSIVKKVVPKPGSLGAILSFVESRTPDEKADEALESTISERSSVKEDPWT